MGQRLFSRSRSRTIKSHCFFLQRKKRRNCWIAFLSRQYLRKKTMNSKSILMQKPYIQSMDNSIRLKLKEFLKKAKIFKIILISEINLCFKSNSKGGIHLKLYPYLILENTKAKSKKKIIFGKIKINIKLILIIQIISKFLIIFKSYLMILNNKD